MNPTKETPDSVADRLEEIELEKRIEKQKEHTYQHGDKFKGVTLKGHRKAYCPKCRIYLPVQFLRFDDKLGDQTIGWACSGCDEPLVAITRSKADGRVLRRYVNPGAKLI